MYNKHQYTNPKSQIIFKSQLLNFETLQPKCHKNLSLECLGHL
mgnify:CR=1 FL=1